MRQTTLTREQILECVRLHALGVPQTRIGKDMGIHRKTVFAAITRYAPRLEPLVEQDKVYQVKRRALARERKLADPPLGRVPFHWPDRE
jgi:predicted DNA-binding protein (UPF0251 family)